ncbi:MAG: YqiA/YcfP family alpha/beta fold hydrolase [Bacteroidia bacterium]
MKVIYLHGFNSDENSHTGTGLLKDFPDLIKFSYNYINSDKGYNEIKSVVENTLKIDTDIILVGTSLGGFWANYFGQKYGLKVVLANPSINPSETLKRYLGENINYGSGKAETLTMDDVADYKKYEVENIAKNQKFIVLGMKDEIVDYRKTSQIFKNKADITYVDEGHQINPKTLSEIVKLASNLYV